MGCMGFSHAYGAPTDRAEAIRVMEQAVEMGYTFFDTAESYTGENQDGSISYNEELVGEALRPHRNAVQIATKFGVRREGNELVVDSRPEQIRNALETMRHYGVVPEAWAPLGGGRYAPFENKTLLKIAAVHGKAVSQVMLRWNVQRGVVVIPKSTHRERIVQNLDIWDFSLTEEEMGQISALDLGYAGTAVKHFDPDFVRMCVTRKIHD